MQNDLKTRAKDRKACAKALANSVTLQPVMATHSVEEEPLALAEEIVLVMLI